MHLVNPPLDVINEETSRRESNMHCGWLQRWLSVEKLSSVPGKLLALSDSQNTSLDQLEKLTKSHCANAQCTVGSSHKSRGPCERDLSASDRGSSMHTDTRLDGGSPAFAVSRPARQNFAAFRSGYVGSSTKAMALVGNQHPISLQNRGFDYLACARAKTFGCVTVEDGKDADTDKVQVRARFFGTLILGKGHVLNVTNICDPCR
ncbi:hypothetical protein L7F22_000671 [Adiantum nelumboides]|nr:hypothetical protein [Adiantum nelumboides]